jgi:hypothetical protein
MKPGTRIEVRVWDRNFEPVWEPAKIGRTTRAMLPLPAGYHPVDFGRGSKLLLVHEKAFRVI